MVKTGVVVPGGDNVGDGVGEGGGDGVLDTAGVDVDDDSGVGVLVCAIRSPITIFNSNVIRMKYNR